MVTHVGVAVGRIVPQARARPQRRHWRGEPYLTHVPSLTGGIRRAEVERFYSNHLVGHRPDDVQVTPLSRPVGQNIRASKQLKATNVRYVAMNMFVHPVQFAPPSDRLTKIPLRILMLLRSLLLQIRTAHYRKPIMTLAALCGFALISMPAVAQGTPEQRAACEGDAQRLCGQFIPDVNRITACMTQNRRYLSARCRAAFEGAKRKRARD